MEDLYITIEKYINGELSDSQLKDFENQLESDPALAEEVKLYKQAKESLTDHFVHEEEESALKATLAEVSPAYFADKNKQAKIIPLIKKYGLAAAGIAAAVLVLVVFNPLQTSLYDRFAEFPTAAFIEQGISATDLSQAQQAFNSGEYAAARDIFQRYLEQEDNKDDVEIQFYLGLCHLALEDLTAATEIFQSIHSGNSAYKYEGTWYLAMTFLKQKEWDKCRDLLQQIPEGSNRKADSEGLLYKIKKRK